MSKERGGWVGTLQLTLFAVQFTISQPCLFRGEVWVIRDLGRCLRSVLEEGQVSAASERYCVLFQFGSSSHVSEQIVTYRMKTRRSGSEFRCVGMMTSYRFAMSQGTVEQSQAKTSA